MNSERWYTLMNTLGFDENHVAFHHLCDKHAESHRRYHTGVHVEACLRHLDSVASLLERPVEMEVAFWFHDAIYEPFSATNEQDSADWAREFLRENDADGALIERVVDLIMATCHTASDLEGDAAYMVDIDLSILGATEEVYDEYEQAIRFEYKKVPGFLYRRKRKQLLQSFLDRDALYTTEHFSALWEASARENLVRAIAAL